MENTTLHGIKSNACPKCGVPSYKLGTVANHYLARNYTRRNEHYEHLGIKAGPNIFQGLKRVSAPDLHMPDLLHIIYLELYKHIMDWIQGFLKNQLRQQAFDNAWKALPPYPGFYVLKKAYCKITQ